MTWSSNVPRAVTRSPDAAGAVVPAWNPDDFALSDRSLRPMNRRTGEHQVQDEEHRRAQAHEEGYARGYAEGFQAGSDAEADRVRVALMALQDALSTVADESARWVGNAEENVVAIALAVAQHVIGRELTTDRNLVVEFVRQVLAEFPLDQPITIRLHPSDLAAVTSAAGPDVALGGARREATWLADPHIVPGGVMVEGRDRIVDGRVDKALERLYRRITATGA